MLMFLGWLREPPTSMPLPPPVDPRTLSLTSAFHAELMMMPPLWPLGAPVTLWTTTLPKMWAAGSSLESLGEFSYLTPSLELYSIRLLETVKTPPGKQPASHQTPLPMLW